MPRLDDELLDAGRRAFARFGYHGATAERIAEEAGVSRVTLHRRGVSKELILGELSERAVEAYRAALWPALTASGNGRDRLERALEAVCGVAEEHLDMLLALRAQSDLVFHEDADEEVATRSVFTEPLERLLLDGISDGSLRPVDAQETATMLFNLVGWTYVHLRTGHRWSAERARAVVPLAIGGLAGDHE
ncbi:MAG: TetR/AcrR family transcriptional regulator [Thermoleophilaceae bacterium]|nr:TetR/AcrR family transcriptional regulator [Thermoleophilaceae bacterium]